MAQMTIELRQLLKDGFRLFDFDYIFNDKKFASKLEKAVIDYFLFHEIGQETPERFKHVFMTKWLQAMDYYNKLHNTTLLKYNPLVNYTMTEALEQLNNTSREEDSRNYSSGEGTTDSTSNVSGRNSNTRTDNLKSSTDSSDTMSDYPQQSIAGGDYLSGQRLSDNETTNTGTVKDNGTNDSNNTDYTNIVDSATTEGKTTLEGTDNTSYEKKIEGMTGKTYQELVQLERENIIRITGMVIEEMKPCFILVY